MNLFAFVGVLLFFIQHFDRFSSLEAMIEVEWMVYCRHPQNQPRLPNKNGTGFLQVFTILSRSLLIE